MRWLTLFILLLNFATLSAQEVKATLEADTTAIKIGEQIQLKLSATIKEGADVKWPFIPDTISKIEIIEKGKIDTTKKGDELNLSQLLTATSFDSGFYVIPPFVFTTSDTSRVLAETEATLIEVYTVPVDTTEAIKDIKAPLAVPLTFREMLPYLLGLIILAILAFLIYRYFKNRKKIVQEKPVQTVQISPYEFAIKELKKLEKEKLWQQGEVKLYYSRLSEIVRNYIERTFHVIALELTTEETLAALKNTATPQAAIDLLKNILTTSDLVKFAKHQPLPDENAMVLKQAFEFVQLSYPQQVQQTEEAT